jgi:phosphoenolpyruvate-protein kinase (PTS system EI component)
MSPIAIPAVKERVRQIDTADAVALARRALDQPSAEAVRSGGR